MINTINQIIYGGMFCFVVAVGIICTVTPSVSPEPVESTIVDYNYCKKLVERPPQKTVWGDIGKGYDCLD